MKLRRILIVAAVALGLISPGVAPGQVGEVATASAKTPPKRAAAKPARGKVTKKTTKKPTAKKSTRAARTGSPQSAVRGNRTSGKIKMCKEVTVGKGKRAKRRKKCSFVKEFQGHGAGKLENFELTQPSGSLWLRSENLQEEVKVDLYNDDGSYNEESLAALDNIFRCKRSKEVRAMDPRLYDQLSRIQDHFEGKQIEVVSGFRNVDRDSSRHFHASAIDIRVKGESARTMYAYAQSLDRGGMGIGIYPNSGFIHVDFRAPGEASYRWTDYSGPNSGKKVKKRPGGRTARAKRPTS